MADQYSLCFAAYRTQLLTLADSTTYFPAVTGREAGWQISENDNIIFEGGDYFIVLRPGAFDQARQGGGNQGNVWTVRTFLFMRYQEYEGLWQTFRAFRNAVLELPDTVPLKTNNIEDQKFRAGEDAGYLRDSNGNYTNFVTQVIDCAITQRALIRRAM